MNNDLISRSEVEKLGAICLARRNENGQLEAIISLDDAPTIEITDYDTGYQDGLEDGLNDILSQGTNADIFKKIFGIYATEVWSMSESQFLEWLNSEYDYKEALDFAIKALEARPQGAWIEQVERRGSFVGDETVYSYTCPFCKVKEFKKYPFCHCGADMRGGRQ